MRRRSRCSRSWSASGSRAHRTPEARRPDSGHQPYLGQAAEEEDDAAVVSLDGWKRHGGRRRRLRVDERGGRGRRGGPGGQRKGSGQVQVPRIKDQGT